MVSAKGVVTLMMIVLVGQRRLKLEVDLTLIRVSGIYGIRVRIADIGGIASKKIQTDSTSSQGSVYKPSNLAAADRRTVAVAFWHTLSLDSGDSGKLLFP
jgi:hypothetical protein